MKTFEVKFSMFGIAYVEASSAEDADKIASRELINWSGFGVDLEDVDVDGVDTEVDE